MTYALNLSGSARASSAPLPLDLQEAVWDLLEQLLTDLNDLEDPTGLDAAMHQLFYRGSVGSTVRLDLAIVVDHDARVIDVLAVSIVK